MSVWEMSFPDNNDADPYTGLSGERDVLEALTEELEQRAEDAYVMTESEIRLEAAKAFAELWPCPVSTSARIPGGRVTLRCTA